MLLLKTKRNFREVLQCAFTPLAFLPGSLPGEARDISKARANDMAVDARIDGFGVTVVESKDSELFVAVSSNESQVIGFARKLLAESQTAEPWFLLLRDVQGPLVKENADRSHEDCLLNKTGFVVNGRTVEIVAAYVPVQNNTAWCHKLGVNIGETL